MARYIRATPALTLLAEGWHVVKNVRQEDFQIRRKLSLAQFVQQAFFALLVAIFPANALSMASALMLAGRILHTI
jgi:hypothetical protein